jgi:hypothetical protein
MTMDLEVIAKLVAVGPVVTVEKPERFVRRLFQAAVEIVEKKSPKATFTDFHRCGSFHRLLLSFFFAPFFFLCASIRNVEKNSRQDRL